ncbi:MAG: hypothetical protein WCO62_00325 [Betaproteobacteria bacterium]
MTFGLGFGLPRGGSPAGLPAFAANFIGGSLPTGSTFSRGTIGTLYNQSGLVAYAPSNLCFQSGFVSGWTVTRGTATQNAGVSPDGTTNAYLVTEDSTVTSSHFLQGSSSTITNATAYTTSFYAKANGRTWIAIQGDISGGFLGSAQYFDIGNGVVGTLAVGVTSASIQSVGNGWFRCLVTATSTSTTASPGLFLATGQGANAYTGNGTSGVYLYGAQLEQSPNATTYTPTTSAAVYGPRFDYDPGNVLQQNLSLSSNFDAVYIGLWTAGLPTGYSLNVGIAPDGTSSAMFWAGAGRFFQENQTALNNNTYTASIWIRISSGAPSVILAVKDKQTDTIRGQVTASATSDWQRINCTGTTTGAQTGFRIEFAVSGGAAFFWGAQVNVGSTALPYIATTSTAQTVCAPRGLLIEETRTNYVQYSQQIGATGWGPNGLTATQTSGTAPDGTNTATLLTGTGVSSHYVNSSASIGTAGASGITSTVYLKYGSNQWVQVFFNLDVNPYVNFDLLNGAVGGIAGTGTTASIANVGNGWFRCTVFTTSTTAIAVGVALVTTTSSSRTETNSLTTTVYAWGAQQEVGAFATSYIPTTSATVTRNFDNLRITSIPWFNASAGTFVAQADNLLPGGTNQTICAFSAGAVYGTGNGFLLRNSGSSIGTGGNTTSISVTGSITANVPYKAASTYQGVNMAVTLNGVTPITGTTNDFTGSGTTTLVLGALTTAFVQGMSGHLRSFSYYNYALTNTQLQAITT